MHLKKHQLNEVEISSIRLWDEVIEEVNAVKKNKINKYLLLILQLLIAALIIILLAKPIFMGSGKQDNIVIAVDCSISMKAYEDGKTHFDCAKEKSIQYINTLNDKTKVDLVILKDKSEIVGKDLSKKEAVKKIEKLVCTSEALNIQNASSVLLSCSSPKIVISDKRISIGDKLIKIQNSMKNLGIVNGHYCSKSNTAYCKIRNYGDKNRNIIASLKDKNGVKRDIQEVTIPAEKEIEVIWSNVPTDLSIIRFSIESQDILSIDNFYTLLVNEQNVSKVLMLGNNYFIEKALLSIPNIKLDIKERWDKDCANYDFYVINNKSDVQIPKGSGVWWTNPDSEFIEDKIDGNKKLNILNGIITKNIRGIDAYALDIYTLKAAEEYENMIEVEERPVMMLKQKEDKREIYSTIDWNKCSITMTPGSPILVHNILNWGIKKEKIEYQAGENIYPKESRKLTLIKPMGNKVGIEKDAAVLDDIGIYKLIDEETGYVKNIVVNSPSSMICDENLMEYKYKESRNALIDMKSIIVIVILCLLIVEWEVYKREYMH
jgi:hypothetical protein